LIGLGLDLWRGAGVSDLGDTEIEELGPLAARCLRVGDDHHILRFEVAVDDAFGMRSSEGISKLAAEVDGFWTG
jgi:hypothetical protein